MRNMGKTVTYQILPVEEWSDEPWYMGENARCLKESCK
jgi:hypothetical protein